MTAFFKAAPEARGGSQARSRIRAAAAGLHHSHSNLHHSSWQRRMLLNCILDKCFLPESQYPKIAHSASFMGTDQRCFLEVPGFRFVLCYHRLAVVNNFQQGALHLQHLCVCVCVCVCVFLSFLGSHPWHMEVARLGVQLER